MELVNTSIKGLFVIEPLTFFDQRGYFFESYNKSSFEKLGINISFVQDNESLSFYGVLRGLHFQIPPYSQAKLVRVTEGVILDVAVDIRPDSETFGKYFAIELSAENKKQLFIPQGFAHGFIVLSQSARIHYKCDNHYNKQAENGLNFSDDELGINWIVPKKDIIVNERDINFQSFREFKKLI